MGSSSWGLVCCVGQQVRPEAPVCLLGRAMASHGLSDQLAVSLRTGAKERSSVRRPQGARFWVCLGPHLPVMPRDGCGGCRLRAGVLRNCCPSLCRGTQGARAPHWGRRPEGLSPPPRRDPERHRWSRLPGGGQGHGGRGEAAGVAAGARRPEWPLLSSVVFVCSVRWACLSCGSHLGPMEVAERGAGVGPVLSEGLAAPGLPGQVSHRPQGQRGPCEAILGESTARVGGGHCPVEDMSGPWAPGPDAAL